MSALITLALRNMKKYQHLFVKLIVSTIMFDLDHDPFGLRLTGDRNIATF